MTCNDPYAPPHDGNTTVELSMLIDEVPAEGIATVKIYGPNGDFEDDLPPYKVVDWPAGATSLTIPWSIVNSTYGYKSGDGWRDVAVRLLTTTGRHQIFGCNVILDRTQSTSDVPVPAFELGGTITEQSAGDGFGRSAASKIVTLPTNISWKAGSKVKRYDLQRLLDASWTQVALSKPKATSAKQTVAEGSTNCFRVRTTKTSGKKLAWRSGTPFDATIVQDGNSSLTYVGSWNSESRADALGGTLHKATAQGAKVKLTFTGRAVAWVTPRNGGGGALAWVYVDGERQEGRPERRGVPAKADRLLNVVAAGRPAHRKIVKKYASYSLPIDALLVLT